MKSMDIPIIKPFTTYLEKVTYLGIVVYCCPNIGNESHDSLSLDVCGKCFSSKYANSWDELRSPLLGAHLLHLLVAIRDSKDVQQLSLVLVDALYLEPSIKFIFQESQHMIFTILVCDQFTILNRYLDYTFRIEMDENLHIKHCIWADNISSFVFNQRNSLLFLVHLCFPPFSLELCIICKL